MSTMRTAPDQAVQPIPAFHVYDTTLRDGSQQEGLTLSVADKLAVARLLDELGVTYIEGGWPGAIPRDTEFFARAAGELTLSTARLAAFGATRKAGVAVAEDAQVAALVDSGAPTITLVAKSDLRHVLGALRTTGEENLAMVRDTVGHLVGLGREVFVDAEHFFDGFLDDAEYTTSMVVAAYKAGAEVVVLCDTNGGMLPHQITEIIEDLRGRLAAAGQAEARLGVHTHNDSGCAVANALTSVRSGITHIQGCVNGYGERTGNADLLTLVADLQLKMGMELIPEDVFAETT
ncbi:MAG: citramalate synthase, partial [Brachybacterium tyrofermentans]